MARGGLVARVSQLHPRGPSAGPARCGGGSRLQSPPSAPFSPESLCGPSGYFLLPSHVCGPCSHDSPPGHVLGGCRPFLKPPPTSCPWLAGPEPCLPRSQVRARERSSPSPSTPGPLWGLLCLIAASLIPQHRPKVRCREGKVLCETGVYRGVSEEVLILGPDPRC